MTSYRKLRQPRSSCTQSLWDHPFNLKVCWSLPHRCQSHSDKRLVYLQSTLIYCTHDYKCKCPSHNLLYTVLIVIYLTTRVLNINFVCSPIDSNVGQLIVRLNFVIGSQWGCLQILWLSLTMRWLDFQCKSKILKERTNGLVISTPNLSQFYSTIEYGIKLFMRYFIWDTKLALMQTSELRDQFAVIEHNQ